MVCVRVCACVRVYVVEAARELELFAIESVENSFAGERDVRGTFESVRTRASNGTRASRKFCFCFCFWHVNARRVRGRMEN
jgi:hypothetical protein